MGEFISSGVTTLEAEILTGAPESTLVEMHTDAVRSIGELSVLPGLQEAVAAVQSGTPKKKFFGSF